MNDLHKDMPTPAAALAGALPRNTARTPSTAAKPSTLTEALSRATRTKNDQIARANASIAQRTSASTQAAASAATPALKPANLTRPADPIRSLADDALNAMADGPDALPAGETPSAADYARVNGTKAARAELFRRATSPGTGKPVMVR